MQGYSRPRLAVAAVAASAASLGGLALGAASAHAASTITVGTGGTYNTIAAGISHASAGDTVTVAAGVYHETLTAKTGVTVKSATPGGAQVDSIVVSSAKGAVIDGFKVDNVAGTAIKINNDDATTIVRNNVVTNSGVASNDATLPAGGVSGSNGTAAVTIDGAVTFTGNTIGNSHYVGVLTSGSAGGALISANEVFNSTDTNPNSRFAAGISVKAPNVTVAGNYSHNNQDSGIQFYGGPSGGHNGVAVNNVAVNNGDHGIDNLNVTGGSIVNNTVVHNQTAGINVEGTSSGYTVENNIAVDNAFTGNTANRSKGDIRIANNATTAGGVTLDHNLLYETAAGNGVVYDWDTTGTPTPTTPNPNVFYGAGATAVSSFHTDTNQGANDKVGNPGFIGATDFHIAANSPAANLADKTVANAPTYDKDGNAWAFSAGAYNAGSTGGPSGGGGTTPPPGSGPVVTRIGGNDRFDTGVRISKQAFPNGAKDVIIATGWKFPDALSGVPLAKKLNAPLLLVDSNDPNSAANVEVKAEIARLLAGGGTLHVLGGTAAVSDAVVNAVKPAGFTPDRIFGASRFETSVAIAHKLGDPKNVVVARGDDGLNQTGFADALSAGPYAADAFGGTGGAAVLLSSNTTLDPSVKAYLAGATSIQAVGGPANTAVGTGAHVQPAIVGGDRYETAAMVAGKFSGEKTAGVAFGMKFPDALTGAAYLANSGGPLLLAATDSVTGPTKVQLAGIGAALGTSGTIYVFGGTAVISETGRTAIATASGGRLA